jgi:hypothetical protein
MKTGFRRIKDIKEEVGTRFELSIGVNQEGLRGNIEIFERFARAGRSGDLKEAFARYDEDRKSEVEQKMAEFEDFNSSFQNVIDHAHTLVHLDNKERPGSIFSRIYRGILKEPHRYVRVCDTATTVKSNRYNTAISRIPSEDVDSKKVFSWRRINDSDARGIFDEYCNAFRSASNPVPYEKATPIVHTIKDGYVYIPNIGDDVVLDSVTTCTRSITGVEMDPNSTRVGVYITVDAGPDENPSWVKFKLRGLPTWAITEAEPSFMSTTRFQAVEGFQIFYTPPQSAQEIRFKQTESVAVEKLSAWRRIVPLRLEHETTHSDLLGKNELPPSEAAVIISDALKIGEKLSAWRRIMLVFLHDLENATIEDLSKLGGSHMLRQYKLLTVRREVYRMVRAGLLQTSDGLKSTSKSTFRLTSAGLLLARDITSTLKDSTK